MIGGSQRTREQNRNSHSQTFETADRQRNTAVGGLFVLLLKKRCKGKYILNCKDGAPLSLRHYGKAVAWYEKAVALGDADAMCGLAVMYERGQAVSKNAEKARELYEKAAAKGSEEAKRRLQRSRHYQERLERNKAHLLSRLAIWRPERVNPRNTPKPLLIPS